MSLLSKLASLRDALTDPHDEVLLVHAMLLSAGADRQLDEGEFAVVEAIVASLPDFEGQPFLSLVAQSRRLVTRYGSLRASVGALAKLSTSERKRQAFVLAAEVALCSGGLSGAERELFALIQVPLGVDDALAEQVLSVLRMKYLR